MKILNKLPNKRTGTLGVFKASNSQGAPSVTSTDSASMTPVSTSHPFQR